MADGRRVVARGHGIGIARDGLWASAAVVPRTALEAKFGVKEGHLATAASARP
jgi:hypothetical protein